MADEGRSIGLVIRHDRDRDAVGDAVVRAIAGPLLAAGMRFVTRAARDEESELRTYRLWGRVGGIAGVILLDADDDDPRIRLLRAIDMPFAALTRVAGPTDFPAVTIDEAAASSALAGYLAAQPAARRVYVTSRGASEPLDDGTDPARLEVVHADDVVSEAVRIAEQATPSSPVALVVDVDRDAVAVLNELEERGIRVPGTVSLICWSDSLLCQSASRPITAIDRHGREIGAVLGAAALAAIRNEAFVAVPAPPPIVVARETT